MTTKNIASKTWCFTLNNYKDEDITLLNDWIKTYLVYGKEIGESGTPHLQGVITFRKAYRLTALKKLHNRVHWEPCKSRDAAINYCMKEGDYVIIDNRKQGARTDLKRAIEALNEGGIKKVKKEHPEVFVKYPGGFKELAIPEIDKRTTKPHIVWIYGPTGVGKSRHVHELFGEENIFRKEHARWWNGYSGQQCILFDDFRGDLMTYHRLLNLCDYYPFSGEIKGGMVNINSPHIYFTSCKPPHEIYTSDKINEKIDQLYRRIDEVYHMDGEETKEVKNICLKNCVPKKLCENFNLFSI